MKKKERHRFIELNSSTGSLLPQKMINKSFFHARVSSGHTENLAAAQRIRWIRVDSWRVNSSNCHTFEHLGSFRRPERPNGVQKASECASMTCAFDDWACLNNTQQQDHRFCTVLEQNRRFGDKGGELKKARTRRGIVKKERIFAVQRQIGSPG